MHIDFLVLQDESNWHPPYSVIVYEDPANISGDEPIAKYLKMHCFVSSQPPNLANSSKSQIPHKFGFKFCVCPISTHCFSFI